MIYEDWQNDFSSKTQVPYRYIKEIGDYWFDLVYGEDAKELFEKELKALVEVALSGNQNQLLSLKCVAS